MTGTPPKTGSELQYSQDVADALKQTVAVIPVWNEEVGIGPTLDDLPTEVTAIVIDNGSTDRSIEIALSKGAHVVHAKERGYGVVCLRGVKSIPELAPHARYLAFVDGDHADHPDELPSMMEYLVRNDADIVLGYRVPGQSDKRSLPLQSPSAVG